MFLVLLLLAVAVAALHLMLPTSRLASRCCWGGWFDDGDGVAMVLAMAVILMRLMVVCSDAADGGGGGAGSGDDDGGDDGGDMSSKVWFLSIICVPLSLSLSLTPSPSPAQRPPQHAQHHPPKVCLLRARKVRATAGVTQTWWVNCTVLHCTVLSDRLKP